MTLVAVFFTVFFILALIVAPLVGEDDRAGVKHPDVKARMPVGSWFHNR